MKQMNQTIQKIKQAARLITLPDIYFQLKSLLSDPDFTMAEVAVLVARDPGMAARFLRIANSPLIGRVAPIETVSHAVSMLGARHVHDIVLGASVAAAFNGIRTEVMDMHQFWRNSIRTSIASRQLAADLDQTQSERMFLIGLLHDIGHLFMYRVIPKKAQKAILISKEQQQPLHLVERARIGFDSAYLAEEVMKAWRLPDGLLQPIRHHNEPDKAEAFKMETAVLHIATRLVRAEMENEAFMEGAFRIDAAAWQRAGFSVAQCQAALQKTAEEYDEIASSFLD